MDMRQEEGSDKSKVTHFCLYGQSL